MPLTEIIESMQKDGKASPRAVELVKKLDKSEAAMPLHIFLPFIKLAEDNYKNLLDNTTPVIKMLPPHPYFLFKFVGMLSGAFVKDVIYNNRLLSQISENPKNPEFNECRETLGQFYDEMLTGEFVLDLENKLFDDVYDSTKDDKEFTDYLVRTKGFMAIIAIDKLKENFRSIANTYIKELNRRVILNCLKYAAENNSNRISNHLIIENVESEIKNMKKVLADHPTGGMVNPLLNHLQEHYIKHLISSDYKLPAAAS